MYHINLFNCLNLQKPLKARRSGSQLTPRSDETILWNENEDSPPQSCNSIYCANINISSMHACSRTKYRTPHWNLSKNLTSVSLVFNKRFRTSPKNDEAFYQNGVSGTQHAHEHNKVQRKPELILPAPRHSEPDAWFTNELKNKADLQINPINQDIVIEVLEKQQ